MKDNFIKGMALAGWLEGDEDGDPTTLDIHEIEGDPGGVTGGFGIIQRTYDAYRDAIGEPRQHVEKRSPDEVLDILHGNYWDVAHCDDLEDKLDLVVFQYALNRSPIKAIKLYQRALGVKSDGYCGPMTLQALACADTGTLIEKFLDYQWNWYAKKRKQDKFTTGLKNRVMKTARFIDFSWLPPE